MLVDFNPLRSFLLIISLISSIIHSQGIVQTASFNDIRTECDNGFALDLYSMVEGPNITFSISGSYSPSLPTTGITIQQNLKLLNNITKSKQSNELENYGGLQIDYSRNLLFTLEGNNITS